MLEAMERVENVAVGCLDPSDALALEREVEVLRAGVARWKRHLIEMYREVQTARVITAAPTPPVIASEASQKEEEG